MKLFKKGILLSFIAIQLISCSKDDEPQNTPPVIKAQSFAVAEDKSANTKIGIITATDVNKDDLTFKITKNDNNLFAVNVSGELSIAANKSLDYETQTKHEITVEVSDGKDKTSAVITINVTDVNENSPITINDQSFTVSEDITDADLIGTLAINDTDGDLSSFSIESGDATNLFVLSNTGELRLASGKTLDYENNTTHTLNIKVSDSNGSSDNATVTINVTNINDVPPTFTAFGPFGVPEDINDTLIIGQIQATDAEGDNISYSLPGLSTTGNLFEIDANNGKISLITGKSLDYETSTYHILTIRISDGVHNVDKQIRINVSDVVETGGNVVNIPDANFKAVLVANTAINTNGDNEIQVTEANNFTGTLKANNKNISDVTGIEEFINLNALFLSSNQISNIDLSNNTKLKIINIYNNQLTSLDVSKNIKLETLTCSYNNLSNIDLTQNTLLEGLYITNNKLSNLNLQNNSSLINLICSENQITSINLGSLTEIKDFNINRNKLSSLDVSKLVKLTQLQVYNNNLSSIDLSNNINLKSFMAYNNNLTSLNIANGNNANMTYMNASSNPDLTCIKIDAGFTPPSTWTKDSTASYNTSCP
ncbi:cadherin domain-containing protein [Tenacibaculum sp. XPcli2-G]|uniref:cadherin domain-containing protein n=1 Tax=Tenacibaculum sp. XPcli2-G TaxID=2954503 RepID=UPI0020978295|nr:cadherin domain-containing protein [Tenacibaculum sp. XPcli2-G]MCO7186504.1 cadherin domain-containing protein [Tenacibaculum sp. XPcli2-G]